MNVVRQWVDMICMSCAGLQWVVPVQPLPPPLPLLWWGSSPTWTPPWQPPSSLDWPIPHCTCEWLTHNQVKGLNINIYTTLMILRDLFRILYYDDITSANRGWNVVPVDYKHTHSTVVLCEQCKLHSYYTSEHFIFSGDLQGPWVHQTLFSVLCSVTYWDIAIHIMLCCSVGVVAFNEEGGPGEFIDQNVTTGESLRGGVDTDWIPPPPFSSGAMIIHNSHLCAVHVDSIFSTYRVLSGVVWWVRPGGRSRALLGGASTNVQGLTPNTGYVVRVIVLNNCTQHSMEQSFNILGGCYLMGSVQVIMHISIFVFTTPSTCLCVDICLSFFGIYLKRPIAGFTSSYIPSHRPLHCW